MNKNNICYTGVGSIKSGNHTKKQYMKVMNKHFKNDCSVHIKSLKCKSCKEAKKQMQTMFNNASNKMTNNKMSNKKTKLQKQMSKCEKCKNNNTKKCNLKNYLLFSGAEVGKC
jgi:hypothetical protein